MKDVVIIGGGIAGLAAAWTLRRAGLNVVLCEAADAPGGHVRTCVKEGFRYEIGPSSFMSAADEIFRLVEELDMEDALEPASSASRERYIFRHGTLHPLPMSILDFLRTPLLSVAGKCRLAMEPFIPSGARDLDTAWDFFVRRFGTEAATYIMAPFVSGVYAGDVRQLGARAAFAKFWEFEKDAGSMVVGGFRYMRAKRKRLSQEGRPIRRGLYSFRGGLGSLTSALATSLSEVIQSHCPVQYLHRVPKGFRMETPCGPYEARCVVLAVPPPAAAALIGDVVPRAAAILNEIPMAPVVLVHWTTNGESSSHPHGFGFLVPRHTGPRVLGTIYSDQLFRNRAPTGKRLFASYYGGMTDPDARLLDNEALRKQIQSDHTEIFHQPSLQPDILEVIRHQAAIPQLLPDHPEKMATLQQLLPSPGGLFLAGNYLKGVGIGYAAAGGFQAAHELLAAYPSLSCSPPGFGEKVPEGAGGEA